MARILATLALVAASVTGGAATVETALEADDACLAGEDCGLELRQLRGEAQAEEFNQGFDAILAEDEEDADEDADEDAEEEVEDEDLAEDADIELLAEGGPSAPASPAVLVQAGTQPPTGWTSITSQPVTSVRLKGKT